MFEEYLLTLQGELENSANPDNAFHQKAYLKNKFEFYGLKTEERRALQKPFLVKEYLPDKKELETLVKALFDRPQREYHHFAQELVFKYHKQFEQNDLSLFEYMITHKSWWDTVDFIATKILGSYFQRYPEQRKKYVEKWLTSDNIWLQRSALLFQLKYKKELDEELLSFTINKLLGSKEFFINKAIGWVLREHSRTNPQWVIEFVDQTELSNLSRKEALRLI